MILLLSGEGPSDIGSCQTALGTGEGKDFKPGPMTWFVEKLVEPKWGYSPLGSASCVFISERALTQQYQNCARFEDLSGNDASPNSAKGKLGKALTARGRSYADVCDMVKKGEIAPQQIQMPSFDYFRERLETVAQQMMG